MGIENLHILTDPDDDDPIRKNVKKEVAQAREFMQEHRRGDHDEYKRPGCPLCKAS